jgi:hypothetical protein
MTNHQNRSASRLQSVVTADPKKFNSRWIKQLLTSLFFQIGSASHPASNAMSRPYTTCKDTEGSTCHSASVTTEGNLHSRHFNNA